MQKKLFAENLMKKNLINSIFFNSKLEQKKLKKSEWCKINLDKDFNQQQKNLKRVTKT